MSGTHAGGLKTAITNKTKYGEDFYISIGRKGGLNGHGNKGFAIDDRTVIDKLQTKPKRPKWAGAIGGKVSRRT